MPALRKESRNSSVDMLLIMCCIECAVGWGISSAMGLKRSSGRGFFATRSPWFCKDWIKFSRLNAACAVVAQRTAKSATRRQMMRDLFIIVVIVRWWGQTFRVCEWGVFFGFAESCCCQELFGKSFGGWVLYLWVLWL